jgi:hypothetical protein
MRYKTLFRLEQRVYSLFHPKLTFEAVSPALKNYLITKFGCRASIIIAQQDIPASVQPLLRQQWRIEMRQKFSLSQDTLVYCYNGSAKPWQCARESIEYFKNINDKKTHLLILSADTKEFETLCSELLSPHTYTLLYVAHADIYRYLALADFGILFRKNHVVNWVSRPTKALEYISVGLKIIHNQTIAYLSEEVK